MASLRDMLSIEEMVVKGLAEHKLSVVLVYELRIV